ncbi:MAG TPA: hypothetical protein VN258_06255, partial [Mobilitalea sp.]|nr:hypothetical protein [Mobilitalea sp.]
MNGYGRFIVIAFAVILIALYPLQYIAQSQSDTIEDIVNAKATEFTDKARHQGYITVDEYEDFIGDLDSTGELYDITIEATHPVSGKELAEANVGEDVSDLSIKNSSLTTIKNTSLTAIKNTSLTTESNHMFHISSERNTKENWNNLNRNIAEPMYSALGAGITLFAVHTHTTDCYAGHNHAASGCSYHTHSGSSTSGGGCYGVANYHSHASSCWGSSTCGGSVNISVYSTNSGYCSACKKNVSGITYAKRCSVCGQSYGNVWVLSCGHGSSVPSSFACTNSISKLICSIDITKPISYSLSCSLYAGYNCGYSNDNNPLCATVVTSITATNPTQSITQGGNIVATATAAYLDGSTGTVNCTVSGFNTNTLGSQVITLTYSGFVGNAKTTGTRSCTVNVTVASAKYPTSISVTPSSSSVYNGMEPSYTVIIKYSDNTTN